MLMAERGSKAELWQDVKRVKVWACVCVCVGKVVHAR